MATESIAKRNHDAAINDALGALYTISAIAKGLMNGADAGDREALYGAMVREAERAVKSLDSREAWHPTESSDELIEYDPAESTLRDRAAAVGLELMIMDEGSSDCYAVADGARILRSMLTLNGAAEVIAEAEASDKSDPLEAGADNRSPDKRTDAESFGEHAARELRRLSSIIEGLNALADDAAQSNNLTQLCEVMERETELALEITSGTAYQRLADWVEMNRLELEARES